MTRSSCIVLGRRALVDHPALCLYIFYHLYVFLSQLSTWIYFDLLNVSYGTICT